MDQLADPVDDLGLPALEVTDEMPAERVTVEGVLRLEVLSAVLAHHLDAGLGERRHPFDGDVFGGRYDRDPVADLGTDAFVAGANLVKRHSRSLPDGR